MHDVGFGMSHFRQLFDVLTFLPIYKDVRTLVLIMFFFSYNSFI